MYKRQVLPLGVGSAIYLTEYATNKKLVSIIEFATETLSGMPSIIFALVGMMVFCQAFGLGTSLIAGALSLVMMTLPTIIRTTQESLKTCLLYTSPGHGTRPKASARPAGNCTHFNFVQKKAPPAWRVELFHMCG